MGNSLTFQYREYPKDVTDGVSSCGAILKELVVFDPLGTGETTYQTYEFYLPGVLMDCVNENGSQSQFNLFSDTLIYADGVREVGSLHGRHRDTLLYIDYGAEPVGGFYQTEIEGEGGVDINLIALYPGYYIGGWFASLEITEYNDAWISRDFQANPDKFNFGEITLDYHGFTCDSFMMDRRKRYIQYRTWMPTLEPGGEPEELNVWVPTPTWDKATGLKWGLYPSVKGVLKVWYMRFLLSMDAYF